MPFQLRSGKSSYIHDPLHARSIAFRNGDGRAVVTLVDAIGVGREMCDAIKANVAAQTDWQTDEILICGTHAHTTPKGGDTSPGRIAYEKTRRTGIEQSILAAIANLEPARVGFGSDSEPSELRNRRWFYDGTDPDRTINPLGTHDRVRMNGGGTGAVKPAGPIDPEIGVIDIRDSRNKPLGLIANYALHYVGGIPKFTEADGRVVGMASADYFGEFSRIMPYRIGGSQPPSDFVAMMTNGASGDINNLPFTLARAPRAPFEQCRVVASKAADASWRAVRKIDHYDDKAIVDTRQREVELTYRLPSAGEIERAEQLLDLPAKERRAIHSRTDSVARRIVEYAGADFDRTEPVIIQAMRIGDQAIVTLPFEVLVEIGLEIKAQSPFEHTMLISLANGGYGYLPTPEQHELGGYETWYGTCRFTEDSSVVLTKHLLEMLDELHGVTGQ